MARNIQETFQLAYTEGNQQLAQSVPRQIIDTPTTSNLIHSTTQLVSSSAHELIDVGDLTDDVLCYLVNNDATAVVSYGVDVAAAFYPFGKVNPGKRVCLGILNGVAGSYVKSSVNDSELVISLFKIV